MRYILESIVCLCLVGFAASVSAQAPPGAAGICLPAGGAPGAVAGGGDAGLGALGQGGGGHGRTPAEVITDLLQAVLARVPCTQQAAQAGEPAALPPSGPGRSAGNPVDLATGNKYASATDVLMPDPESGLAAALVHALGVDAAAALGPAWQAFAPLRFVFTRHYNSRFDSVGPLGPGWRHGFETALARLPGDDGARLQVVQADGRRLVFRPAVVSGHFESRAADGGRIVEQLGAALPWAWHWPDGRVLHFDRKGALARIEAPDGDRLLLDRDAEGRLGAIHDRSGRSLRFAYAAGRMVALRLPGGARIRYTYDPHGVLVGVHYPDGRRLRYHYEDLQAFHLLTGIELPDGRRSRYRYDNLRRVVESVPREGRAAGRLSFAWLPPAEPGGLGQTSVKEGNRLSTWQWRVDASSGEPALLSVAGEPCGSCPSMPSDEIRVAESAHGRSKRMLTYDRFGLPSEAWITGYRRLPGQAPEPVAMHLRWHRHADGPLAGKLASVERVAPDGRAARTVFGHDRFRRLVSIARPEGLREAIVRDRLGRPVRRQGADRLRHTMQVDAHWRLTQLQRGDAVFRLAWNAQGQPVAIDWPEGHRWTLTQQAHRLSVRSSRGWQAWTDGEALSPPPVRAGMAVAIAQVPAGADDGALVRRLVDAAGRRTDFHHDDFGRLIEESAPDGGWRRYRHDAWGRVSLIETASGRVERRQHDLAGRLLARHREGNGQQESSRFEWLGALLVGIHHPGQVTRIRHDEAGRVSAMTDRLGDVVHRWAFQRDGRGRVVAQRLPGGAWLDHRYDEQGRLVGMAFRTTAQARPLPVVDNVRHDGGQVVGWRFGNGTRFERRNDPSGRPRVWRWLGAPGQPAEPLLEWHYQWHGSGMPVAISMRTAPASDQERPLAGAWSERRLGWDALGRLIIDQREGPAGRQREFFAWGPAGELRFARAPGGTSWRAGASEPLRDADGHALEYRGLVLARGPGGRVAEVRTAAGQRVARYAYNAAGERVTREVSGQRTGFLYRDRALVAETDGDGRVLRHYLRWQGVPVAVVDHGAAGPVVSWLHGDPLGTAHAATDAQGRTVWRGEYLAFGRLLAEQGSLHQPLRLAGQYHDPETGLHDNYLRSYDPDTGRYLEPDPLGLAGGLDRFAYADGNPVTSADPLGLILFAFDGTNNGATPPGRDDRSNVWKFFELYDDGAKWYMTGVGLDDPASGIRTNTLDPLDANTARARVDFMLGELDNHLGQVPAGDTVTIDVVGFSRGAAMARDFANRISAFDYQDRWLDQGVCVDLRFLGLWDTVAQFGLNGRANHQWRLGIPAAAGAVFHAVALNEHRRLFPLEAASGSMVVERGFVGSHADVGGGNAEGDLSDISLVWMAGMARQAGIVLKDMPPDWQRVDAPIVHDRNYDLAGDRRVATRDATGQVVSRRPQRQAAIDGLDWAGSQAFLVVPPWRERDAYGRLSIVGTVDLAAYSAWLAEHYSVELEQP